MEGIYIYYVEIVILDKTMGIGIVVLVYIVDFM